MGLQLILASHCFPPLYTLWFTGLITLYYGLFVVIKRTGGERRAAFYRNLGFSPDIARFENQGWHRRYEAPAVLSGLSFGPVRGRIFYAYPFRPRKKDGVGRFIHCISIFVCLPRIWVKPAFAFAFDARPGRFFAHKLHYDKFLMACAPGKS